MLTLRMLAGSDRGPQGYTSGREQPRPVTPVELERPNAITSDRFVDFVGATMLGVSMLTRIPITLRMSYTESSWKSSSVDDLANEESQL